MQVQVKCVMTAILFHVHFISEYIIIMLLILFVVNFLMVCLKIPLQNSVIVLTSLLHMKYVLVSICILKCVQWYTNYPIHFVASYLIPGVSI